MFSCCFFTKGKAVVAPEAFMVVGTVGRAARRRDFLGTHVGQNGRIGHFLIGLGKSPQSSDTVSVGSTVGPRYAVGDSPIMKLRESKYPTIPALAASIGGDHCT